MFNKPIFTLFIIICSGISLQKVKSQDIIIDQVVAVVGNNEILLSDIENQYLQMLAQGYKVKGDMKCELLEDLLVQKLLLNQAEIDSIEISENQVEMELNSRLNYYIQQIGGEKELEDYFNKSIVQIKDDLREDLREQIVTSQMRSEIVGEIKITPSEIKNFYKSIPPDSLPLINGQVEFYQILKYPPYSEEAIIEVREKLLSLRERILNGERFSKLAALYSEGPSAPMGGELGFMSKAELDPEYAKAAFALQEGAVSKIVESSFGFHIIQLIEKRGDRVNTRHIIIKPKITYEQSLIAQNKLDSILTAIKNDSITFENAARLYSDDKETRVNGGQVVNPNTNNAYFEVDQLPPQDYVVLKNLKPGETSEPYQTIDSKGKTVYKIVMLKSLIEPHKANLDYDFNLLKNMATAKKQEDVLMNWVKEKQKSQYIRVNSSFANCSFHLNGWVSE